MERIAEEVVGQFPDTRTTVVSSDILGGVKRMRQEIEAVAKDEAEIVIGGITLRNSGAVVMASEDLYVSADKVRVSYRFTNPTAKAVTTTVAFPMPRQPRGMGWMDYYLDSRRDWSDFRFSTRVNGKPVAMQLVERAMVGDRDVTARIAALGFPLYWFEQDKATDLFEKMPAARRAAFIAEGLAVKDQRFAGRVVPAWDVAGFFVREQVFPPRATIAVEHEYAPITGGSVSGALYPAYRKDAPDTVRHYRERYCTDADFFASFDRLDAQHRKSDTYVTYGETWIGYVLSSGANWKGPIGDFRLVVDKGTAGGLVSFCMDGVRKISPTRFEVRKRNFEPKADLNVLIVTFHHSDE